MSRVRRGVLSLRVVRQMLSRPHKSFTCGNDKFYSLNRYLPSVTQRHLGAWKVMWEMQQLGRRAGALNIDLMSKQPGKQKNKLLSSLLGVVLEKRWKMFEGRAAQAVLISLLSTDEARGINSFTASVSICVKDAAAGCTSALSCAVSSSVRFFPVYPAERCVLNGKVTLVLKDVPLLYELSLRCGE